jgi:hypothetical protein
MTEDRRQNWFIRELENEGIWQRGQKSEIGSQREEDAVQRRYRY